VPAQILDGQKVATQLRQRLKEQIQSRVVSPPRLAVVLCGADPASQIYVRKKREACAQVGITSYLVEPFGDGLVNWPDARAHLLATIDYLNHDPAIHGILVQLPLPKLLDQYEVFDRIDPLKDVDVLTPINTGLLLQGRPRFVPCTPQGIQTLLEYYSIPIEGRKVAIINRSDIVGKPLGALLIQDHQRANATVTVCHDRTPPDLLKETCLAADIVVVAVGKPNFLTPDMVHDKSVVIDVGINRVDGCVVGDVAAATVHKIAAVSPVPGGVGPMTVTMLLKNTIQAWRLQLFS
jgi:methylenetetrahydrofolate dehydrogenase (NADP+)/methenyltetrahydrofolate cyclohydrolase